MCPRWCGVPSAVVWVSSVVWIIQGGRGGVGTLGVVCPRCGVGVLGGVGALGGVDHSGRTRWCGCPRCGGVLGVVWVSSVWVSSVVVPGALGGVDALGVTVLGGGVGALGGVDHSGRARWCQVSSVVRVPSAVVSGVLGGEGALGGINAADAQMGTQRGSPARRAVLLLNQSYRESLMDTIALIINYLDAPLGVPFTGRYVG